MPPTQAAPGATRFGFTKIVVRDLTLMTEFYERALALKLVMKVERPELAEHVLAVAGHESGPFLVLYHEFEGPALAIGNAWGPIGFETADVDATVARALALGGRATEEPFDHEDLRIAFFLDPEGHRVELVGPRR